MKILIHGKNLKVPSVVEDYAREKVLKLKKFIKEPATVEVVFEDVRGGLKAGRDKMVHITVILPGEKQPIHVEELSDDFAVSIDAAEQHLRKVLERYHEKGRGLFRHVWRRVFSRYSR